MEAVEEAGLAYVSDNPRRIGGITFTAVKQDIYDSVGLYNQAQAKKYLLFVMLAASTEFAKIFGHEESIKELNFLIETQTVFQEALEQEPGL